MCEIYSGFYLYPVFNVITGNIESDKINFPDVINCHILNIIIYNMTLAADVFKYNLM